MVRAAQPSNFPSWFKRICSGVGSSSYVWIMSAMWPISVFIPVAVTTPRPRPYVTSVPRYAVLRRSPKEASRSKIWSARLSTGTDSPVSDASSILRFIVSSRRTSAGTKLPASTKTMSPGTTNRDGRTIRWPPRSTCASGAAIFLSAANASSALFSCTTPIAAFRITMATIAAASTNSTISPDSLYSLNPIRKEIAAATMRMITTKSLNWASNICQKPGRGCSTSSLDWVRIGPVASQLDPDPAPIPDRFPKCATSVQASGCARPLMVAPYSTSSKKSDFDKQADESRVLA